MIQNFTDLVVYQKAHSLVLEIYLVTKKYPSDEKFCLVNQMRRAIVSVTSNIAEGFSRNSSKDKAQFYAIAKGSVTEIQSQLLISKDLEYIKEDIEKSLRQKSVEIAKMLSGLINSALDNK